MFAHCGLRTCVCAHATFDLYALCAIYKTPDVSVFFYFSLLLCGLLRVRHLVGQRMAYSARSARLGSHLTYSRRAHPARQVNVNNDPCVTFLSVIKNTLTLCAELLLHRLLLLVRMVLWCFHFADTMCGGHLPDAAVSRPRLVCAGLRRRRVCVSGRVCVRILCTAAGRRRRLFDVSCKRPPT